MGKKNIICVVLAIMLFFVTACSYSSDLNDSGSKNSLNSESSSQQQEPTVYKVSFYDRNKIVATKQVSNLQELTYPSMEQRRTTNNIDYDFKGWDATGDGIQDELEEISSNLILNSVYVPSSNFVLSYTINNENKSLEVTNQTNYTLEVPLSTNELIFLYYQDENGYPYTDEFGKKLINVDVERSMTLTAKFLDVNAEIQQIYYSKYPSKRVKGNELNNLVEAIEKGTAITFSEDANHFQLNGIDYQRVTCVNRGNIFNDLSMAVQNETYYFRYTPVKWDVTDVFVFSSENGYEFEFCGTSSDVLKTFTPTIQDVRMLPEAPPEIITMPEKNDILERQLEINENFYFLGNMICPTIITDGTKIVDKIKKANDYLIASSNIEISYEKGTMFTVNYVLSPPVNILAVSDSVYINNFLGEKTVAKANDIYGLINCYRIRVKVGQIQ